jgi:hypothetical protein
MILFMRLRACAAVILTIWPLSAASAQNQIPVIVHWEGDPPSEMTAQEESGPIPLRPNTPSSTFSGHIPRIAGGIRRVPLEVRYGSVTFPLELRVRPATTNIEFTIISSRPESCSGPYVSAIRQRTISQDMSIRRALSATHMLAREGPANNCTHHRAAVLEARYERYADLMRHSPHFFIPRSIETSFLEEMAELNQGDAARQLVGHYRDIEVASSAMILQADVLATLEDSTETALASSEAIQDLAAEDANAARVIYSSQIERNVLERQTSDIAARVALEQQSFRPQ